MSSSGGWVNEYHRRLEGGGATQMVIGPATLTMETLSRSGMLQTGRDVHHPCTVMCIVVRCFIP